MFLRFLHRRLFGHLVVIHIQYDFKSTTLYGFLECYIHAATHVCLPGTTECFASFWQWGEHSRTCSQRGHYRCLARWRTLEVRLEVKVKALQPSGSFDIICLSWWTTFSTTYRYWQMSMFCICVYQGCQSSAFRRNSAFFFGLSAFFQMSFRFFWKIA